MEHDMDIIVLIPAYQPDQKLLQVIEAVQKQCSVVVVDDGSGEEFRAIFEQANQLGAVVVHHAINLGKGRALKTGFNQIMQLYPNCNVVTADADGQHRPDDILRVAETLRAMPNQFVFGGRSFQTMPARSKTGNTIMRFFFRAATGCSLSDTQTGLRGIPAIYLPAMMELKGERYEYEMSLLMELRTWDAKYIEIPIETLYYHNNQKSHFRSFQDGIRVFGSMLRYCISALLSAAVDYGLYFLLLWLPFTALTPSICFAGARLGSCIVNYIGNRYFVFRKKNAGKLSIILYFLLVVFGILVGSGGIWLLTRLQVPAVIAKIVIDVLLFFFNFIVQKNVIFVNRSKEK